MDISFYLMYFHFYAGPKAKGRPIIHRPVLAYFEFFYTTVTANAGHNSTRWPEKWPIGFFLIFTLKA